MADDSNRPSKWRRILGRGNSAGEADPPSPETPATMRGPSASRRKFLEGAATGAAAVAVDPANTAKALAGAALSVAAPAAAVASSAAADPSARMVPRALAYLSRRAPTLAAMGRDFLDIDVKPYSASLKASIIGEIKSALDGKPLDAGGTLDRDAIFNTARFLEGFDRLGLYNDAKMRELTLAELSPPIIEELLHLSGDSRYFDARREATLHALDIIKGVTGAGEEETLGAIADRVGRQAMAMVDGILAHPERMPTEFSLRNSIWYHAHDILSAVAQNQHNKFGLSDPTGIFPRVRDRLVEMNLEEEEMRRNLSEHWKKKRIEESGKTVKEPEKGAACRVYRMDATEREKERGIRRAFLIQPPPKETLTHADILGLCRELKDKRVLYADFRPTAVETQWLAAQGGDVKPPAFGMRVSSSDPRLRKYLGDCAEGRQSLVMPPLNRERTR